MPSGVAPRAGLSADFRIAADSAWAEFPRLARKAASVAAVRAAAEAGEIELGGGLTAEQIVADSDVRQVFLPRDELPTIPTSPDDIGAQPAGNYATAQALTDALATKADAPTAAQPVATASFTDQVATLGSRPTSLAGILSLLEPAAPSTGRVSLQRGTTNLVPDPLFATATPGILGSGGALPAGWERRFALNYQIVSMSTAS